MTSAPAWTFEFPIDADDSLNASMLIRARGNRFDLIVDVIALLAGGLLAASGYPIGLLLMLLALGFIVLPGQLMRWKFRRDARSFIGKRTTMRVGPDGIDVTTELGTSHNVPWSTATRVLSNDRTVVLVRDRVVLTYIPASAFSSTDERRAFVTYARERVGIGPRTARN